MSRHVAILTIIFAAAICLFATTAQAQTAAAGIQINASGELKMNTVLDVNLKLKAKEAQKALGSDLCTASEMRCISLKQLEKAIEANNGALTEEMKYLAGLTRIEYVFFIPETKDIIIAGPAEGWFAEPGIDRVIGVKSRRPVVRLEDLASALRMYGPNGSDPQKVGCSIDPTPEGLVRLQAFIKTVNPQRMNYSAIRSGMVSALGNHTVRIDGVNPNTHFAKVLVEADYRMKLIGIGLEKAPAGLRSFISAANPEDVARNAMCRWYFVPNYQCVRMSPDGSAIQLVGQGVKLVGEDEVVSAAGNRQSTAGSQNTASKQFTQSFTSRYEKIAQVNPVYGELRNLIDLSIIAAYMNQEDIFGKAEWSMPILGDETKYSIETVSAPQFAPAACALHYKNGRLMTPIGGGVEIQPQIALNEDNLISNDDKEVAQTGSALTAPEGKWWWNNK